MSIERFHTNDRMSQMVIHKALTATIWLCSMDDFAEMNAVWDAWATGGNAPCRACVESPRLASPDFTVEIGLIAAR